MTLSEKLSLTAMIKPFQLDEPNLNELVLCPERNASAPSKNAQSTTKVQNLLTNSGQKGGDGQCGAINVPLARDLDMKMRTLDKIGIGGTSKQFSLASPGKTRPHLTSQGSRILKNILELFCCSERQNNAQYMAPKDRPTAEKTRGQLPNRHNQLSVLLRLSALSFKIGAPTEYPKQFPI